MGLLIDFRNGKRLAVHLIVTKRLNLSALYQLYDLNFIALKHAQMA